MSVFDDLLRSLGGGQYGDPSTPAMPAAPMGQGQGYTANVLQHLQDVLSGKVAAEGALGQNNYDPNRSFSANALNPNAIEQASELAGGIGPGAIRAYHGSPHKFPAEPSYPLGRFDPNKVGTGEGAQAYGHGMPYLAEAEPVAETYLRDANWLYGGRKAQTIYDRLNNQANERGLDNAGWDRLNAQRGFWEKVSLGQSPRSIIDEARANPDWFGKAELDYIQSLDPNKFKRSGGHMYEVDIHADPKQFLDWDKALTEQSPQIQDVLASLSDRLSGMSLDLRPGQVPRGQHAYSKLSLGDVDPNAPGTAFSARPEQASAMLRDLGVPGIRYLDQASRDLGKGTSNYVMFDPKIVEILRRYGILPPIAAGGLLGAGSEPPT